MSEQLNVESIEYENNANGNGISSRNTLRYIIL